MKTIKETIDNFLAQKNIAVVGVSRSGKKFGNAVYKELKTKGYNVFPINPFVTEIEGEKCFPNLNSIPQKPDGLITIVPPEKAVEAIQEANEIGIKNVWLQQGSSSDEAVKFCAENNINVVNNECIFMFLEPVKSVHSFHRWLNKIFGKYPK